MTPDQINRAWKLRAQGKSYKTISLELGGPSEKTIRLTLHPELRISKSYLLNRKREHCGPTNHKVLNKRTEIPETVLAEAEAAKEAHKTLSQSLLGDPLPGRSALDKREPPPCPVNRAQIVEITPPAEGPRNAIIPIGILPRLSQRG